MTTIAPLLARYTRAKAGLEKAAARYNADAKKSFDTIEAVIAAHAEVEAATHAVAFGYLKHLRAVDAGAEPLFDQHMIERLAEINAVAFVAMLAGCVPLPRPQPSAAVH